ncbi:MAG TPA: hypothetical protein VN515_05220 [Terriglobales bacterium]|nr:hypothetical protein [Terriglobales bacterium]
MRVPAFAAVAIALLALPAFSQQPPQFNQSLLRPFIYRNIGPFWIGARASDIAVPTTPESAHLYTFYVSFWTGGVWKTTNGGTTFQPVFDSQNNLNIGAIAVAPSNENIVWAGTGDAFTSRSSLAGNGVYKSTDAGKTWANMGLADTQHIARILVHPANPDVVYVAAMGHLFSDNDARGVYRTRDGGRTWKKVLDKGPHIGVIDLVMDPAHPAVLYAATYDKTRLPWQLVPDGPGSAIYKTTDGGDHWTQLGGGLPANHIGRIGLDIYRGNPQILYAIVENDNPRTTPLAGARRLRPGVQPVIGGEVYRTGDGGRTWQKMNADGFDVTPKGPYYFNQIRVDPNNDQNIFVTQDGLRHSINGGRTWDAPEPFPGMFGDVRTLWIDPTNSNRMIQGSDGGIAVSYDGGRTSDALENIPVGEVYALSVDNADPYNIYEGLQDHENWRCPSATGMGRVTPQNCRAVGDGDGIATVVDPTDSRWLYTDREYGGHSRVDQKLGIRTPIQPHPSDPSQPPYRFLWEPPIVLSPHDAHTIYTGGQMLLKSTDRGDHWTAISPDLSTHPSDKILPESEGGLPGGIPWFAISSISESPLTAGEIWTGTSDGKVWVTRDGGKNWTDLTADVASAGGRADAYVSRVRASAHVPGRAYLTKSGYRFDDFAAYVFRTDDYGATWTPISAGLPAAPVNVITEDPVNPDLVFLGDDAGVYVSFDRGAHWKRMNNNIPRVGVHDIVIQSRQKDLVVGTYGRGVWITNIAPLEQLTPAVLAEDVHLFTIPDTVQRVTWQFGANDYLFGQQNLRTPNPPNGTVIWYYLKQAAAAPPTIAITDASGQQVAQLTGSGDAGLHSVVWNTRRPRPGGRRGGPVPVQPGQTVVDQLEPLGAYNVTLEAGAVQKTAPARITATQGWSLETSPEVIRQLEHF